MAPSVALVVLVAGAAAGLRWWQVLLALLVLPSVVLAATALLLSRPDPAAAVVVPPHAPTAVSPALAAARSAVEQAEQRLVQAVQRDPHDEQALLGLAAEDYTARLALAAVQLAEQGTVDPSLQDELVATHLGLLQAQRVTADPSRD